MSSLPGWNQEGRPNTEKQSSKGFQCHYLQQEVSALEAGQVQGWMRAFQGAPALRVQDSHVVGEGWRMVRISSE